MKRLSRLIAVPIAALAMAPAQSFEEVPVVEPAAWEDLIVDVFEATLAPARAYVRVGEVALSESRRDYRVSQNEIEPSRLGIDVAALDLEPSRELDPADRELELATGGRVTADGAAGIRTELRSTRSADRLSRLRKTGLEKPEPKVSDGVYVVD